MKAPSSVWSSTDPTEAKIDPRARRPATGFVLVCGWLHFDIVDHMGTRVFTQLGVHDLFIFVWRSHGVVLHPGHDPHLGLLR